MRGTREEAGGIEHVGRATEVAVYCSESGVPQPARQGRLGEMAERRPNPELFREESGPGVT